MNEISDARDRHRHCFLLTYAGIALGRVPGFRLDRAGIALTGAALMMAIGAVTPEEAYRAVNLDTLALLLGMMIVVAHLRLSGFFRLVTSWALVHAHSPLILLATVTVTAGAFSAFLVNDAVCLVMTPLVIEVTRSLRRDPIPYLLAVAMASNIGSAATITGNPQNMIVGAVSRIPYVEFAAALAPVAAVGLVVVIVVLATCGGPSSARRRSLRPNRRRRACTRRSSSKPCWSRLA